jgi:hypothetical protein
VTAAVLARVAPSAIAGAGTVAARAIAAGTELALGEAVNHSCEPNLWWAGPHRFLARREIAAGEELTYDYATVIADPQFLLRCHCESYRCRQMVTGEDWQIPQLQRLYAGRWGPDVRERLDS